jgi:hypothetical protein
VLSFFFFFFFVFLLPLQLHVLFLPIPATAQKPNHCECAFCYWTEQLRMEKMVSFTLCICKRSADEGAGLAARSVPVAPSQKTYHCTDWCRLLPLQDPMLRRNYRSDIKTKNRTTQTKDENI